MIRRFSARVLWLLFVAPGSLWAHDSVHGGHNFFDGLLYPLFVPAHLLLLIALGLFYGQQGVKACSTAIKVFVVTTALGLAGSWFSSGIDVEVFLLYGAIVVGLLVAANPVLDRIWCAGMGVYSGIVLGLDSAQASLSVMNRWVFLFGDLVGIFLLLLHSVAFADYFKSRHWQRIGIRILGSWVSASALLVLALSLTTKR